MGSLLLSFQVAPPPFFIFTSQSISVTNWIIESIVFKPGLGNDSPVIKNYTNLLLLELLMLNHAGLGCGSWQEYFPTVIEAWVLSPAAYICGELGVVLQTCNADLVVMLGLGNASTVIGLRPVWAILKNRILFFLVPT